MTLAPYDWAFRQVATNESFAYKSQNLTQESELDLQVIDRPLKYLRVQETCQPNDTEVLKTYGGLVNCSRCAEPSTKVGENINSRLMQSVMENGFFNKLLIFYFLLFFFLTYRFKSTILLWYYHYHSSQHSLQTKHLCILYQNLYIFANRKFIHLLMNFMGKFFINN